MEKIESETTDEQFHSLSKSMSSKPPTQNKTTPEQSRTTPTQSKTTPTLQSKTTPQSKITPTQCKHSRSPPTFSPKTSKPLSTASPQKSSLKPHPHTTVHLPKQLVSSVVRKVQSIGRPKSPKAALKDSKEKLSTNRKSSHNVSSNRPKSLELLSDSKDSLSRSRTDSNEILSKCKSRSAKAPSESHKTTSRSPTKRESRSLTAGRRSVKPQGSHTLLTGDAASGMESSTELCGERLAYHQEKDRSLSRSYNLGSTHSPESQDGTSKHPVVKPNTSS